MAIGTLAELQEMVADLPTSLTFRTETHSVIWGDLNASEELQIAGVLDNAGIVAVLIVADWTALPGVNDAVTVGSVEYRVQSVSDSPDGLARNLTCQAEDQ